MTIDPKVIAIRLARKAVEAGVDLWVKVWSNPFARGRKLKQRELLLDKWEEKGFNSREEYLKFKQEEYANEHQTGPDNTGSA